MTGARPRGIGLSVNYCSKIKAGGIPLLMDDSLETRRALREFLEGQGITIVGEAAEGAKGIELAQKLMPDVVLMDVKMLGIDGIEATEVITSSLPERTSSCSPRSRMSPETTSRRGGAPPTSSRQAPRSSSPTPSSRRWVHRDR